MLIPTRRKCLLGKGKEAVAIIEDEQQSIVNSSPAQIESAPVPAVEEAGAASLDKVRDILFGGQMRDLDRRFARVEERLTKETADLEDELRKRLATIEQFARTEAETLAQRIKAEHDERADATREVTREIDRKLGLLDDQLARAQRELRQQILELHQRVSDEIRERFDAVMARLGQEARDLRADKADRVTLAALFTEVAMRLTSEPGMTGEQEPRRG